MDDLFFIDHHFDEESPHNWMVVAVGKPGIGGVEKRFYLCKGPHLVENHSDEGAVVPENAIVLPIQNGEVDKVGYNGVVLEQLLVLSSYLLEGFQNGEYHCHENLVANEHINRALEALADRRKRIRSEARKA